MDGNDALLRDFLLDSGLVSRSQLSDALERAQDRPLAEALAEAGLLAHDELRRATAHALGVPFVELVPHEIAEGAMLLIPEPLARAHNVFAYGVGERGVEVAVLDLRDLAHVEELGRTHRVLPRLTSAASMRKALLHYQKHLKDTFGEMLTHGQHVAEALISHALYSRAGGVHIDSKQLSTLVRYQIGHTLHEAFELPEQAGKQLVAQLKALAKLLPVARPQEGKFKVEKDGGVVHVRVHAMPSEHGERLHVRLAHAAHGARGYTLESLGMHGEALARVECALAARHGLLVVAGGTGSGKTTLIHTIEDLLKAPHVAIVRASSAEEMRAALRHDPDVLIVDDLREQAAATLATAAAQRGVFVVAGVDPTVMQLSGDVVVELARVERLCTKAFYNSAKLSRSEQDTLEPYADFMRLLGALKDEFVVPSAAAFKDVAFARATPCSECVAGYTGSIGLQQVSDVGGVVGLALVEDGLFKAAQGLTSVAQIIDLLQ